MDPLAIQLRKKMGGSTREETLKKELDALLNKITARAEEGYSHIYFTGKVWDSGDEVATYAEGKLKQHGFDVIPENRRTKAGRMRKYLLIRW